MVTKFSTKLYKAAGNQHLQFTAEIWTNDKKILPYSKKDKAQVLANNELPLMVVKMNWSHEGGLQFGKSRKKG